jgi:hypothetical protein
MKLFHGSNRALSNDIGNHDTEIKLKIDIYSNINILRPTENISSKPQLSPFKIQSHDFACYRNVA